MSRIKKVGKGLVGLVSLATVATGLYLGATYLTMKDYLHADIDSELTRVASSGKPTGGLVTIEEHVKTARDFLLFGKNRLQRDDNPGYDLTVDKTTNTMYVFNGDTLIRTIDVGTGEELIENKDRFGQYVTPNGEYLVIKEFDQKALREKFGQAHADKYYAVGMLQLSGPWAPHIAIHGTPDPDKIGKNKSHGCINVGLDDMAWIMDNVGIGSTVSVYMSATN
tara:strand:- start:2423 stop:3091 length:669 start_codon:yes stop_codon:yes gene_type:complete